MTGQIPKRHLKLDVVTRLRDDIIHGRLRPGEVLRDLDLAARYGVSTSPVREAIADMVVERLIEVSSHSVKRVAPLDRQRSMDFFAIFRLLALHGFALGAERMDTDGLARMEEVLGGKGAAGGGSFSLFAEFHDPVFVACGNRELRRMLALSRPWLQRLVILLIGRNHPRDTTLDQAHKTLAELKKGNAEQAVALFCQSLDELQAEIEKMPEIY